MGLFGDDEAVDVGGGGVGAGMDEILLGPPGQGVSDAEPKADGDGDRQPQPGGDDGGEIAIQADSDGQAQPAAAGKQSDRGWNFRRIMAEDFGEPGIQAKYTNDDDAIKGMLEAYRLVGQRNEDAELGKLMRGREADLLDALDLLEQRRRGVAPTQAAQAAQAPQPKTEDNSWMGHVAYDANGELVALPGAPPDAVAKAREYVARRDSVVNDLVSSPEKVLGPVVERLVQQRIEELQAGLGAQLAARDEQQYLLSWADRNKAFLFNDGNPQKGLSMGGMRFCQLHDDAGRMGVAQLTDRLQYATRIMQAEAAKVASGGDAGAGQAAPPLGKAMRRPPVAAMPARGKFDSHDERVKNMSLEEHLLWEIAEEERRKSGMG